MATKAKPTPKVDYQKLYSDHLQLVQQLQTEVNVLRAENDDWKRRSSDLFIKLDTKTSEVTALVGGLGKRLVCLLNDEQRGAADATECSHEVYALELFQCYQEGRIGTGWAVKK
jgi:hypothetical protein